MMQTKEHLTDNEIFKNLETYADMNNAYEEFIERHRQEYEKFIQSWESFPQFGGEYNE